MGAAVAVEVPAAETRERLAEFVAEVVSALPHVRQRENALVYVRGLIEQGGRKSLQPTLFRLEETPARYESVQQFLADSPWQAGLVVRACAERVAPEIGVLAWVVDDTGIGKQGKHSPGVKRQYSGTLGKIGNCQITVSVHAVGTRGTVPLGWSLYLPEEWCEDELRRARAKIPATVAFATKPQLAAGLVEQASSWELPAAPILADCAYGDDSAFRTGSAGARAGVPARCVRPDQHLRTGDDLCGAPAQRQHGAAAHRRPTRSEAGVGACTRGAVAQARLEDAALPHRPRRRADQEPLRPPPRRRDPSGPQQQPAAPRGVADHRMAARSRRTNRLLALQPAAEHAARAARAARAPTLDDRTRLPTAERRARTRPLRGTQLPWLPPPLRPRHLRARLPHARTARPKSPAAGLTLPQTVPLLQPVLRCWAGRCRTCRQPVHLNQLTLFRRRE